MQAVINENHVFELLLVNHDGYITEGSRTNVFFVKQDKLYTPPSDKVLMGITRKHIYNTMKIYDITIIEKLIHVSELDDYEGVFLTGTSIKILTIAKIDHICYSQQNSFIYSLIDKFNKYIDNYFLR